MQKLKEILKKLIEEELNQTSVEISGSSLEEALSKASAELGVDISELDYEIKEFGSKGVFGLGKKDFVVNVYKSNLKSELFQNLMSDNMNFDDAADYDIENQITNKDSEAFLRVTSRGVLLKVTPPIGKGKKISESEILNIISTRRIQNFNREMVKKVLKNLSGEYTR
ncbi:MAG TPA: Jag N-terminal domain-containing protein, partial [Spirochaetota bacterium]|nr:Jag N-terminal domain-containing protein [Spirochaetota bacterium]